MYGFRSLYRYRLMSSLVRIIDIFVFLDMLTMKSFPVTEVIFRGHSGSSAKTLCDRKYTILCILYIDQIGRPKHQPVRLFGNLWTRSFWQEAQLSQRDRACFVSLNISSYLTLNNIVTLKSGLRVTQGHWKWYHSKAWVYGFQST